MLLFYRTFTPRFERVTLELSQAVEYEADAAAADAVGPRAAAEALVMLHGIYVVCSRRGWPAIFERARDEPEPPADVYAVFTEELRQPIADAHHFLHRRSSGKPPRTTRIPHCSTACVRWASRPPTARGRARPLRASRTERGDVFLSGARAQRRTIAAEWSAAVRPQWRDTHANAACCAGIDELSALGDAADPRSASRARSRRRGSGARTRSTWSRPTRTHRPTTRSSPRVPASCSRSAATSAGSSFSTVRCGSIRSPPSAWRRSRARSDLQRAEPERAAAYETRLSEAYVELYLARQERETFTGTEPIAPHGLTHDELAPVRHALDLPDIEAAYLARRTVTHLPGRPHFVLAVLRRKTKQGSPDHNIAAVIISDLKASFAHGASVFVSTRPNDPVIAALRAVNGTAVAL